MEKSTILHGIITIFRHKKLRTQENKFCRCWALYGSLVPTLRFNKIILYSLQLQIIIIPCKGQFFKLFFRILLEMWQNCPSFDAMSRIHLNFPESQCEPYEGSSVKEPCNMLIVMQVDSTSMDVFLKDQRSHCQCSCVSRTTQIAFSWHFSKLVALGPEWVNSQTSFFFETFSVHTIRSFCVSVISRQ